MKTPLGYTFKDQFLLEQALRHSSAKDQTNVSNERLEFLGDAVLGMVTSELLYLKYPEKEEGELTIIKSEVVSRPILSAIALAEGIDKEITLGKGIKQIPDSILANALEAILGAIYLDGGLAPAKEIIDRLFLRPIEEVAQRPYEINYKAALQHYTQKYLNLMPEYQTVRTSGPAHRPVFEVTVKAGHTKYGTGTGRTKKEAEQNAAKETLEKLRANYS